MPALTSHEGLDCRVPVLSVSIKYDGSFRQMDRVSDNYFVMFANGGQAFTLPTTVAITSVLNDTVYDTLATSSPTVSLDPKNQLCGACHGGWLSRYHRSLQKSGNCSAISCHVSQGNVPGGTQFPLSSRWGTVGISARSPSFPPPTSPAESPPPASPQARRPPSLQNGTRSPPPARAASPPPPTGRLPPPSTPRRPPSSPTPNTTPVSNLTSTPLGQIPFVQQARLDRHFLQWCTVSKCDCQLHSWHVGQRAHRTALQGNDTVQTEIAIPPYQQCGGAGAGCFGSNCKVRATHALFPPNHEQPQRTPLELIGNAWTSSGNA